MLAPTLGKLVGSLCARVAKSLSFYKMNSYAGNFLSVEENERRLLFYVAEKARLKNSANEVSEKFCEIISVRHLTCRNLFLRVGKEFYFGDKIPFFPVNLRGAGNIHSGLYKKASRCVVPNFIKMRIFYEKILPHKIHLRFFYPKMEIFY